MRDTEPKSKGCSKCGTQNPGDARFCCHCGAGLEAAPGGAARSSARVWIALGAAVVVLAACGAWWMNAPRPVATPSFDAAPPPSMSAASEPAAMARDAAVRPTLPVAATAASATAAPPSGDLWEPIGRPAPIDDSVAIRARQAAKLKAERDARARALREQRTLAASQAEAEAARRRIDAARGRGLPAATPAARGSAPTPETAPARSVQDRCANKSNALTRAICEARECVGAEHAGEPVCDRIRAADDRRREQ